MTSTLSYLVSKSAQIGRLSVPFLSTIFAAKNNGLISYFWQLVSKIELIAKISNLNATYAGFVELRSLLGELNALYCLGNARNVRRKIFAQRA